MDSGQISPKISRIAWGEIQVRDKGKFKDAKLYPGGAREWDWGETGTSHVPGIQPEDVMELLENGSQVIVLSEGMLGRLKVCRETLDYLSENGISFYREPTRKAVSLYNRLRSEQPVGGLFHTTC